MAKLKEIYVDHDGNAVVVSNVFTTVDFHNEGGGFIATMPEGEFHLRFKLRENPPPFKQVTVTGEWLEHEAISTFQAYSNDIRWNGWVVPYFIKSDAQLAAAACTLGNATFDEAHDAFILPALYDGDEDQVCKGVDIDIGGVTVHAYNIGNGWCWELADAGDAA